jgi:hypothetical protein
VVQPQKLSFSHQDKNRLRIRAPLRPLNPLNASHHLRKNRNKVEQNILLHQDAYLGATISRSRDKPKKTQLIVNRPYYQQYFTPKTSEEILLKHRSGQENEDFYLQNKLKSALTSLHVQEEDNF